MLFILLFLACVTPIGAAISFNKLSQEENVQLQRYCGTKPWHQGNSAKSNEHRSIYGGIPIPGNVAPWTVQIHIGADMFCSGVIISSRHVLSASHCIHSNNTIDDSKGKCMNGELILEQDLPSMRVENANNLLLSDQIAKLIIFGYCPGKNHLHHDFMIIELKNNIQLNDFAFPACVNTHPNFQNVGVPVMIVGYGHNAWPWDNDNPILTLREGFTKISLHVGSKFETIDETRKFNQRPGDSGGGALVWSNHQYFVVGIYLFGTNHLEDFLSGYASVYYHRQFICYYTGVC